MLAGICYTLLNTLSVTMTILDNKLVTKENMKVVESKRSWIPQWSTGLEQQDSSWTNTKAKQVIDQSVPLSHYRGNIEHVDPFMAAPSKGINDGWR